MNGAGGRRWWRLRAAAGAALLCGVMVGPARAQTATAPGNSSANPGTTPPQAGPGSRLDLPAETAGASADTAASTLSAPAQTGNANPHPSDSSGPVVRSTFDETDISDEHPVGEPADVGSSFDRQDSVNDHPVP
ncbi:MAG TPA: hypothetical protein VHH90_08220 [Polyangia bacterium]|nr:hypothetical protein [Polyangia bacterium]